MRNYFKRLNIAAHQDKDAIEKALTQPATNEKTGQWMEDARLTLLNDTRLKMYRQIFVQYEAMRAAQDCLESSPGVDTNHWQARLGNFDVDPLEKL